MKEMEFKKNSKRKDDIFTKKMAISTFFNFSAKNYFPKFSFFDPLNKNPIKKKTSAINYDSIYNNKQITPAPFLPLPQPKPIPPLTKTVLQPFPIFKTTIFCPCPCCCFLIFPPIKLKSHEFLNLNIHFNRGKKW